MFHTDSDPGIVADFTINIGDVRQTMDGFGASDYFLDVTPLSVAQADLFFDATAGIGLSILRCGPRSDGSIDGFYANATKAAARGARIIAEARTATAAQKTNASETGGGHLLASAYGAYSDMLTTFASGFSANTGGVTLYGLELQNEPDWTSTSTSMLYTSAELVAFLNVLGPKLHAVSPAVNVIVPATASWDTMQAYLTAVMADATAPAYLDIAATHQYGGTVAPATGIGARRVWMTEMSYFNAFDATMTQALIMAADLHSAVTTGNVTAWLYWWLISGATDNEGLIGNGTSAGADTTPTKRLYALGNWSKFVRPGQVRLGTTGTVANVSLTAFRSLTTGVTTLVAINTSTATSGVVRFNGLHYTSVTPWITDATRDLVAQSPVAVAQNVFTMSLAASSVTSFVGTGT